MGAKGRSHFEKLVHRRAPGKRELSGGGQAPAGKSGCRISLICCRQLAKFLE